MAGYSTVLLLVFGSVVFYSIFSCAELMCTLHLLVTWQTPLYSSIFSCAELMCTLHLLVTWQTPLYSSIFSCATLRCTWSVLVTRLMPNFLTPRLACTAFWTSIKTPSESTSTFQPQVRMQAPVLSLLPLQGKRMVQSHKPCLVSPSWGPYSVECQFGWLVVWTCMYTCCWTLCF